MEVRAKGLLLPYHVFSKDQRVSHTAIVENKRLGHALAVIKAQQDTYFTPKVNTNSQKGGYQKRRRNVYGPDYIEPATPIPDGPYRLEQNSISQEAANDRNQIVLDRNEVSEMVENKRLGQALAVAKRMQDLALPPKVYTNSQKLGYQKRGRQIYGSDYVPKIPVKSVKRRT